VRRRHICLIGTRPRDENRHVVSPGDSSARCRGPWLPLPLEAGPASASAQCYDAKSRDRRATVLRWTAAALSAS
jgi:hypothetical protein